MNHKQKLSGYLKLQKIKCFYVILFANTNCYNLPSIMSTRLWKETTLQLYRLEYQYLYHNSQDLIFPIVYTISKSLHAALPTIIFRNYFQQINLVNIFFCKKKTKTYILNSNTLKLGFHIHVHACSCTIIRMHSL